MYDEKERNDKYTHMHHMQLMRIRKHMTYLDLSKRTGLYIHAYICFLCRYSTDLAALHN